MYIFVYGTLKRGHGNYPVIERAMGRFISEGYIDNKAIYYAYPNSFPAVVNGMGRVYGEIFDVPEKNIHILDGLEGYRKGDEEHSMYLRKRAKATLPNEHKLWVSYYHWNRPVNEGLRIPSGVYPLRER